MKYLYLQIFGTSICGASPNGRSQTGLSLIEVLAAGVLSGLTLVLLAPPLAFISATRVQNQRVEQARALAQQEIDRVQAAMSLGIGVDDETVERDDAGKILSDELPALVPPESDRNGSTLGLTAAPDTVEGDRLEIDTFNKALEVDVDGDSNSDFLIQTFRDSGRDFAVGVDAGELAVFRMGVRVYDIQAKDNLGYLSTEPISSSVTTGGATTRQPLYVLFGEISRSDTSFSLEGYRNYICSLDPGCSGEEAGDGEAAASGS